MTKIYACLTGDWVCLNDDPNCVMGPNMTPPSIWWEEEARLYAPIKRDPHYNDSFYGLDFIVIHYNNKDYRINPVFIQIVES